MTTNTTTRYPTRTLTTGTPLVFAHHTTPRPHLMRPIRNIGFTKPDGGLWTCPLGGYAWQDWCLDEHFKEEHELVEHLLTVTRPATLAVIDTTTDLRALLDTHSTPNPYALTPSISRRFIDFEGLSREVDGIWLTTEGEHATRWSTGDNLYGWDLESILLFTWIF